MMGSMILRFTPIPAEYILPDTGSENLPERYNGAQTDIGGNRDAFVAELDENLSYIAQSTYLGGSDTDEGHGLAIHPTSGNIYVTGLTLSDDLPMAQGGALPTPGGDHDGFVAYLHSDSKTLYQSTYLGTRHREQGNDMVVHPSSGQIYVTGVQSPLGDGDVDFPGVAGGAQEVACGGKDAFLSRFSTDLTTLHQSTYLGGSPSYLGGSGHDAGNTLAVESDSGDIFVAGSTSSADFPGTEGGAQDSIPARGATYISRLNSDLTTLRQSTYLGGTVWFVGDQSVTAVEIHPVSGQVYVAGYTGADDFPGTAGGAQESRNNGTDGFVSRLTPDLARLYTLTVNGGEGGGQYARGTVVNISANEPPAGKVFDQWTGDTDHVADVGRAKTTVTFPAADVTVTAT